MAEEEFDNLSMSSFEDEDMDYLTSIQEQPKTEEEEEETQDPPQDPPEEQPEVEESEEDENKGDPTPEEEEEEESVAEQDREEGTPSNDISKALFSFASALHDEGVLTSFDKDTKIESASDLIDMIEGQIRENEYAGLNETQRKYLDALKVGIPSEEFLSDQKKIQDVSKVTKESLEEDEGLRRELIYDDYISRGYTESRAKTLTQRSFDNGADVEDAELALESKQDRVKKEVDKKVEERQKQIEQYKKSQAERQKALKKEIFDEEKEIIPGIRNTKAIASKVYDTMTKPVDFTEDGRPLNKLMKAREEDPIAFEHRLYYLFEITNGFKDFNKILKTSKSKAAKDFESKLGLNTFNEGGSGFSGSGSDDFDKALNALEKTMKNK